MMSCGNLRVLLEVATSDLAVAAIVSESDAARALKLILSSIEALGGAAGLLLEQHSRATDELIHLPDGADIMSPEQYTRMKEMVDRYANLHPSLRDGCFRGPQRPDWPLENDQKEEEDEQLEGGFAGDQTDREDSESESEAGAGEGEP